MLQQIYLNNHLKFILSVQNWKRSVSRQFIGCMCCFLKWFLLDLPCWHKLCTQVSILVTDIRLVSFILFSCHEWLPYFVSVVLWAGNNYCPMHIHSFSGRTVVLSRLYIMYTLAKLVVFHFHSNGSTVLVLWWSWSLCYPFSFSCKPVVVYIDVFQWRTNI